MFTPRANKLNKMRVLEYFFFVIASTSTQCHSNVVRRTSEPGYINQQVNINTDDSVYVTEDRFLSVALDASLIRFNWDTLDFSSVRVQNLLRGLKPAYLRIGGTSANFLLWQDKETQPTHRGVSTEPTNFTFTPSEAEKVFKTAKEIGLDIIFGLNFLLRTTTDQWDCRNAESFMNYLVKRGYHSSWELGNEPIDLKSLTNRTIPAEVLARDFNTLRALLEQHPQYGSFIAGPDVGSPWVDKYRVDYLTTFLNHVSSGTLNTVTYHQYYMSSVEAILQDYYDVHVLDKLLTAANQTKTLVGDSVLWLGETSSTYGSGKPGYSDTYVAGFMWLDKLGIAALHQHHVVVRQSFYGGHYSLIDRKLDPLPDYWTSVLYKRLVGPTVLMVEGSLEMNRTIRVYAHCTSPESQYTNGSIVLLALNILKEPAQIILGGGIAEFQIDQYLLTPGIKGQLTSQTIRLNDKVLQLVDGTSLPALHPVTMKPGNAIIMPALSYGYYVIVGAHAKACMNTNDILA